MEKVHIGSRGVLDAFTWHQYYLNGHIATLEVSWIMGFLEQCFPTILGQTYKKLISQVLKQHNFIPQILKPNANFNINLFLLMMKELICFVALSIFYFYAV